MKNIIMTTMLLGISAQCIGGEKENLEKAGYMECTQFLFACLDKLHRPEVVDAARDLNKLMGRDAAPMLADRNPGCCLRVEVFGEYGRGYTFEFNTPYGARLTAGSAEDLKAAVEFLKRKMKHVDGKKYLPRGVFTTFKTEQVEQAK